MSLPRGAENRPHIFIVEDEPFIADQLEEIVIALGYETGGVAYALQPALAVVRNRNIQIDAAIVDLRLREGLAYEQRRSSSCHMCTRPG